MSTRSQPIAFSIALLFLCSCVGERSANVQDEHTANAYYGLLKQATCYVITLKAQNRLPGVTKDEHGNLQVNCDWLMDDQGHFLKKEITFPITFTAYWTRSGDNAELSYKVTKDNEHGGWRLDGAWIKDKNRDWTALQ